MNKRFSTLLATALVASGVSAFAQAEIVKGDYYYLETQTINSTPYQSSHLIVSKDNKDGKETLYSIFAKGGDGSFSPVANGDSALWKVDYTVDEVSGAYSWVFKNKATGTQLSVAAGSNAKEGANGVKVGAPLAGSMKFAWGTPTEVVGTTEKTLSSYIASKDSTLSFALTGYNANGQALSNQKQELKLVMTDGSVPAAGAVKLLAVRAPQRALTKAELNDMLGKNLGFQLFFNYKNALTTDNNALAGKIFEAEAVNATDTLVNLKAKTLAPKYSPADAQKANPMYQYAYVDTVWYDASVKSTDGSGLTFKVDTLPTNGAANVGVTKSVFRFRVDPSSARDSVAIFVESTYTTATPTAPRTWAVKNVTGSAGVSEAFPLQINPLAGTTTDKKVLTTAAEINVLLDLNKDTRITFKGESLAPLFDATKVYSVKNVNERTGDDNANKYMVVAPISATAYGEAYSNKAFDHLPSTQFVFDGAKMINRELASVNTQTLYTVEGKTDVYTNLADTFEIKAMADVNLQDSTMGWAYINEDSLTNYAFSLDYISGILEGRSINVKADSAIVATTEEGKLFKLEAAALAKVSGAAEIDDVKTLYNQAYKIFSKDKKFVVVKNGTTGKLALTSVTSAAGSNPTSFYLKETENKGEYILVEGTSKYNVNSTNESLEAVALNLTNNAFAVQVEKAPEYVLDAKGHYNIENLRGDMLAADAQGFGMFRKEGELKAAYEKNDFALYIDTAKIHATQPSYFILSGAKTGEGSELEGNFLRVMTDSVAANVEGYTSDNGLTRLAFVPAKREATSDSLLVNYKNETLVKADSVDYKGKNTGKIAQFQFKIQYTETEGEYIVENAAGYLATYNDVLCLTNGTTDKVQAQLVKLTQVSAPTANEGVEVSEVKVIAGEGQVTIAGAAGKKVAISNILGQVVANTVLTSDNAAIAVPQGVVVVAVEGEEAVKAIVK